MKRIAAITMVRGDAFYLRKWTAWYGGQLGEENLYILLDGRDQPLPDWCPKAHVIPCDRVGGQVARADKGRIERISDEAARMTQDEGIQWNFLGWGAYKAATEAKAAGIKNITFLEKVPYVEVPKVIAAHDVVLGVFGTTAKAARVIGNKVYECMACCRPTINEFCTGYPPEAKDCKAIKFVPPGDAKAIADAVRAYRDDWANRDSYFAAARGFFEKHLSMAVVEKQLAGIVGELVR